MITPEPTIALKNKAHDVLDLLMFGNKEATRALKRSAASILYDYVMALEARVKSLESAGCGDALIKNAAPVLREEWREIEEENDRLSALMAKNDP